MVEAEEVSNTQVIMKNNVNGLPEETNMILAASSIRLKLPEDSDIYVSCDPYMRNRMQKLEGSYVGSFIPGSVGLFHLSRPSLGVCCYSLNLGNVEFKELTIVAMRN